MILKKKKKKKTRKCKIGVLNFSLYLPSFLLLQGLQLYILETYMLTIIVNSDAQLILKLVKG